MPPESPRIVVVGAGAGGLVVAAGAALFGVPVMLVERRETLGGDCLNFGCVPSKAFIRAAHAAHALRTADRFGLPRQDVRADLAAVMGYVHGAIATIAVHDDVERFRGLGVEVVTGEAARFLGPRRLQVGDRVLTPRHVVLATGSRPAPPAIPGLADGDWYDNESLWHAMKVLPERLVVVGGGPIGCELGQAFARLGARVTIVQRAARLLEKEDPQASAAVAEAFTAEGLDVRLGVTPVRAEGRVLVLSDGARVPYDAVLVAAGRLPNVEALDLAQAGVARDARGYVQVDAAMRTTAKGVYAVGDVTGGLQFTHVAEAQAKVALRNMLFPLTGRMAYDVVPWATFTDPEVARVGRLASELEEPFAAHVFPFKDADRAVTDDATRSFVKVLATPKGRLLGATIVGAHAGELIHELALAMQQGVPLSRVSGLIHAYPTLALANRRAADAYMKTKLAGPVGPLLRWLARR